MSRDDDIIYADIDRVADDHVQVETSPDTEYTLHRDGDVWVADVDLPTEVVAVLRHEGYDVVVESDED